MPLIPDASFLGGDHQPSVADPRTAGMPGRAAAQLGEAVGDASRVLLDISEKTRAANDLGHESAARIRMQEALGEHQKFRIENPDESTWGKDIEDRLGKAREDIGKMPFSPQGRQEIDRLYNGWESDHRLQTGVDAAENEVRRARQNNSNLREQYGLKGMFDDERAIIDREVATGLKHPETADVDRADIAERESHWKLKEQDTATRVTIAEDPASWLESNKQDSAPEGVDPVTYQSQRTFARQLLREKTFEVSASLQDGMASGEITRPEQIDDLAADLRPAAREALKADLAKRADAGYREKIRTPEYQNEVVGRVAAMLDTYDAESDGYDEAFVRMDGMVRDLPDGAVKAELTRRLDQSRTGQLADLETNADFHRKALADVYKGGGFGSDTVTTPLPKLLNDGLLQDTAKLQKLGMSPAQAAMVASGKATAGELKAMGIPEKRAKELAGGEGQAARVSLFRELYDKRQGFDESDPYDRAAFEAVKSGNAGAVDYPSAAAMNARDRAFGEAKTKLEQWLRANPDATEEQGRKKLYELVSPTGLETFSRSLLTAPPVPESDGMVLPPKLPE